MQFTNLQLAELKQAYIRGENLTELIKSWNIAIDSLAIEIIYDLQAGSYTKIDFPGGLQRELYLSELATLMKPHLQKGWSVLDAGIGEATTLLPLLQKLDLELIPFGIDISWSRLSWAKANSIDFKIEIALAVADLKKIPARDSSIDCVLTMHSIEPNFGKEMEILSELKRVAKSMIILIEPDFKNADTHQKTRMQKLGFIGDLDPYISQLGLEIVDFRRIENNGNPLNKAGIWFLKPTDFVTDKGCDLSNRFWVDPLTKADLNPNRDGLASDEGFWYPISGGIPFLRPQDAKYAFNPAP